MNLVIGAVVSALCTEGEYVMLGDTYFTHARKEDLVINMLFTTANYLDILLFVPMLWMVYHADDNFETSNHAQVLSGSTRQQVLCFFAYLCGFYLYADVLNLEMHFRITKEPLEFAAHGAHFLVLLDFAAFVLFRAKGMGSAKQVDGEQMVGLLSADVEAAVD